MFPWFSQNKRGSTLKVSQLIFTYRQDSCSNVTWLNEKSKHHDKIQLLARLLCDYVAPEFNSLAARRLIRWRIVRAHNAFCMGEEGYEEQPWLDCFASSQTNLTFLNFDILWPKTLFGYFVGVFRNKHSFNIHDMFRCLKGLHFRKRVIRWRLTHGIPYYS